MNNTATINAIYSILDSYRKNPYQEKFSSDKIVEKIEYFVNNRLPIELVFPGFHGKVNNSRFVFSDPLDLGEQIAVKHITSLCDKIMNAYPEGLKFNIVHEGHFYVGKSPLVTSQDNLDNYLNNLKKILAQYDYMKSHSIYELIPEKKPFPDLLDDFWNRYVPSDAEVAMLIEQATYLNLYKAYKNIHAVHFQTDPEFNTLSRAIRRNKIKSMAVNQMKIYFGFGKLVKEHFKDKNYIRLSSLYKDPSMSDCVAINYLPNNHHLSTPTFNCLVEYQNGKYDFIKKYIATEKNFILAEMKGLKYFQAA